MSTKTASLLVFLLVLVAGVNFPDVLVLASFADINHDGVVDAKDAFIVVNAYGSYPGDPDWDPRADLNDDVSVDIVDVTLLAKEYVKSSSSKLSSIGGHSPNWTSEVTSKIYQGSIEPPDLFVSNLWWAPQVSAIHRKYPQKRVIIYRNLRIVDKTRTREWAGQAKWYLAEYEFARQNNIICKDSSGNEVYSRGRGRNYLLADIGNPKWQQFVADWIRFYVNNFDLDGVFLDNGLSSTEAEIYWDVSAKPINPRTGNYYTDEEIVQYNIQIHRKIRETIGNDDLIICNGIFHGEKFFKNQERYLRILTKYTIDGFTSEGIFGQKSFWDEERWQKSVEFVRWIQDNWLEKGKIFVPHVNWYTPQTKVDLEAVWVGFEEGYSLKRAMTYYFASTLLGIEARVSELNFFSVYGYWYEPFAQELYSLDLGEPTTDYYRIEGTHVYARKFQKGLVMTNPTPSSYTISLHKNYKTLNGEILSSLTIRRHEGVILFNT